MRCAVVIACLAGSLVPAPPCRAADTTGPYENGKFKGRIAYSCDGNHNDPDDWAASPVALAIVAACGAKDRLVHFDYNCILPKTDPEWEKKHADSVLGAAERYGFDKSVFHDCRKDPKAAVASIAKAVNDSSADNPLYFIVAGPMEVPVLGLKQSDPAKRKFVYCISHSAWNDGFAAKYTFTHTKRSVIELGVRWVQIRDQNALLSLSPYGRPAKPEEFKAYDWMRDANDPKLKFLWDRLQVSTRPDPSDAGMAYFLLTGDEQCDPARLQRLLAEKKVPEPVRFRTRVRLEAENFSHLEGYELEYRNDRTASHRVSVKPSGKDAWRIRTPFNEPYTATRGRYDVEVRYYDGDGRGRYTLLVNGVARGDAWESAGKGQGWTTHTIRDVEINAGDEVEAEAKGTPGGLDYVQFNYREPTKKDR
jgi:hypothetical protein